MKGTIKLTKAQIATKLQALADKFPQSARMEYSIRNEIGFSTIYKYLKGDVSSAIVGEHLLTHIEQYVKDNKKAA